MRSHWVRWGYLALFGVRPDTPARVVAFGPGTTGRKWASIEMPARIAEGGRVEFHKTDERESLLEGFHVVCRGRVLRRIHLVPSVWLTVAGDYATIEVPEP